jgi:hypothetical protein
MSLSFMGLPRFEVTPSLIQKITLPGTSLNPSVLETESSDSIEMYVRGSNRVAARYSLGLLIAASAVAIISNAVHAVGVELNVAGLILVGVVPPLAALGSIHQVVVLATEAVTVRERVRVGADAAERRAAARADRAGRKGSKIALRTNSLTKVKVTSTSGYPLARKAIEKFIQSNARPPGRNELHLLTGVSDKSAYRYLVRYRGEVEDLA